MAFSNEFAMEMRDLMLNPPQEDTYSRLKDLINRTAVSNKKLLQLLLPLRNLETGNLPGS